MKHLILNKWGKDHKMTFHVGRYQQNGNLYIELLSHDDGYAEPWQNLTVNTKFKCLENCAFIDTNNNGTEIIGWLIDNNLGYLTGCMTGGDFCIYPEFEFNMETLMQYVEGR